MLSRIFHRERRHHFLYVTQNTEYHLRDQLCVAVRDRSTGLWQTAHPAIGQRMSGALMQRSDGSISRAKPQIDAILWFQDGLRELFTSRVIEIARPPKAALSHYLAS